MRDELDEAMERLKGGDRRAFDVVFERAWPRALAYATRALSDPADAEDAAQQALEKVFARAAHYDPSRSALAWILAITAWEIRTVRTSRRRADARRGAGSPDATAATHDLEADVITRDLREAAADALSHLSPEDRRLVEDAIENRADVASGPVPAVERKRRQRAWERLRVAWRTLYGR